MITNRNISPGAFIDITKIQGFGAPYNPQIGDVRYVAKSGLQARTWLQGRVPEANLHKTLDDAIGACTSSRGDTVYVAPGHTETITGAGGITLDKIGINILGLGRYDLRPTFLMDGADCSMLVTAANASLENCVFSSGHADLAYLALVTAKGFRFANNYIDENTAAEDWITAIQLGAADNDADGAEIVNNEIVGIGATATGSVVINKNQNDVKIVGNSITGQFGASTYAPIYAPSTEVMINIRVAYNLIHNLHNANAAVGISIANTASTGWVHNNYCYALDVAGGTPFLGGATGIANFENYYTFEGNKSGYIMPTMGTAA
jgi:hypothetical protein